MTLENMPPLSGIPNELSPLLTDSLQRPLRDLRISVTDRCNMRCTYCMPRAVFDENYAYLPRAELLTFEEIERVARVFADLGVQKIRLTGGEPLLRRGIEKLIERLALLRTLQGAPVEIALTTNAVLLAQKAIALKAAGLSRLTVSLDSLKDDTFKRMTDSGTTVATVLEGIAAAKQAGFVGIKVNMVVRRGVNDAEILPMAAHFRHSGVVLRFIEYMDVGCSNAWRKDDMVSASETLAIVSSRYPVTPVAPDFRGEVAERWRYDDGAGEIGVIASVTQAFCRDCTRMRLSTDGKLFTCLFASTGTDIRSALRHDAGDASLARIIIERWGSRDDRYSELRHLENGRTRIEMSYIGG
ncbi:MAG: cyclic pyranopterin phosphate synthase [Sideroxydans sp. RIFOXYB12_FULL_59_6]|nr:MAG: cyclic pyranopterin phosphate synthase [Sideroxydans sp. RIFOXYB12_FULL_59_6]